MLFDVRMGPQALSHNDRIYIVYQANQEEKAAHPHIVVYDRTTASWSPAVQLATNPARYDHHFAPIVWMDDEAHLHVLFGCHLTPGRHLISRRPEAVDAWEEGPQLAESISYPTVKRIHDNKLLLFYRALGHLGFWAYRVSTDGGYTWTDAHRVLDFDQQPRDHDDADTWAGEYASVCPSADGRSLHIGFVYWDERRLHPWYRIKKPSRARYHLYYLRLDLHDRPAVYRRRGRNRGTD